MKVSPGCSSARNTAWFIWLPEFGCTLAKLRAEQLLGALDRQRLGDVDEFAAAVIAVARIAFGIFVGHHRALRFQHRAADDVFRRDQLDLMALAAEFAADRGGDIRIGLGKRGCEERVGRGSGFGRRLAGGFIGEISPPPQALERLAGGHVWRSKAASARLAYRGGQAKRLRLVPGIYARYGGMPGFCGGRSPDAAQRVALAERCAAEPGPVA